MWDRTSCARCRPERPVSAGCRPFQRHDRRRLATGGRSGVEFRTGNGRDLAGVPDNDINLVIAAHVLPYFVRARSEEAMPAEIARVLTPGGDCLVFNWSYRRDHATDQADAHELAARHKFEVLRSGEQPFAIWDATGFHLRRPA